MKICILVAGALVTSCSGAGLRSDGRDARRTIIESVVEIVSTKPDFVSGYVATWIVVELTDADVHKTKLYIPYMKDSDLLPTAGQVCTFQYTVEPIKGLLAAGPISDPSGKRVKEFSCK